MYIFVPKIAQRILIILVWNIQYTVTNKIFLQKTFSSTINTLNLGQKCTSGILLHWRKLTIWTSLCLCLKNFSLIFQIFTSSPMDLDCTIQFSINVVATSCSCKNLEYLDQSSTIGRIFLCTFKKWYSNHDVRITNVNKW